MAKKTLKATTPLNAIKGKKMNPIQVSVILSHIKDRVKQDPGFKKVLQSHPIEVLTEFGLSKQIAGHIIAQEVGVNFAAGDCWFTNITSCCASNITTCCVSSKELFGKSVKMKSLPAMNDKAAWKQVLNGTYTNAK